MSVTRERVGPRVTLSSSSRFEHEVERRRIEDPKRRLERTDTSVDEISWRVGYEDAAFFRRLFKRTTGLSPAVSKALQDSRVRAAVTSRLT